MTTDRIAALDQRIAAANESLAPVERGVARFFVSHRDEIPFMTARQIADEVGTSAATVVRAAQSLGYGGLPELKEELAAAIRATRASVARIGRSLDQLGSDPADVLAGLLEHEAAVLEETQRSLDTGNFRRAVALLADAERVVAIGPGPAAGIITQLVLGLRRFGHHALGITERGSALAEALLELDTGDVVLLLAFDRLTKEIEVILTEVRMRGVECVVITDTLALALSGRYTVALSVSRGNSTLFPTHVAILVVIEALLLAITGRKRRQVFGSIQHLNSLRESLGAL